MSNEHELSDQKCPYCGELMRVVPFGIGGNYCDNVCPDVIGQVWDFASKDGPLLNDLCRFEN